MVRGGKEGLFEERYYKAVFPNGNPDFYLTRYWLMRAVIYHARGNPERTYAKWVVLNFLWGELAGDVRRRARAFRTINESPRAHSDAIGHLDRVIERVLLAAVKFYREERGKGSSALDPSAFCNSRGRGQPVREVLDRRRQPAPCTVREGHEPPSSSH